MKEVMSWIASIGAMIKHVFVNEGNAHAFTSCSKELLKEKA